MIDEVFLGAVRADVALQGELTCDDLFNRNLLVPAVATVAFFAARLGHFLGAAQGAAGFLVDRLSRHSADCTTPIPRGGRAAVFAPAASFPAQTHETIRARARARRRQRRSAPPGT